MKGEKDRVLESGSGSWFRVLTLCQLPAAWGDTVTQQSIRAQRAHVGLGNKEA